MSKRQHAAKVNPWEMAFAASFLPHATTVYKMPHRPKAGGADLMVGPYTQVMNASRSVAAAVHMCKYQVVVTGQLLSPAQETFTFCVTSPVDTESTWMTSALQVF